MKLKLLNLCILWLIGWLILLPNFSSALDQNFYPNTPATILDWQNNDLELKNWVNFILNDNYRLISVMSAWTYPRLKNVFWTENWLYFIDSCQGGYSCQNINTSIKVQWYIQNYYECDLDWNVCDTNSPTYSSEQFFTNNSYSNPDYMLLSDTLRDESALYVCFAYSSLNKMICFMWYEHAWNLNNSIWFTYNPLPSQLLQSEDQISSYFTNSPFISSDIPNYFITWSVNSAQNLYDSYRSLWYRDVMCYWWFWVDDLLLTWSLNFRDMQVWSGATIFQLHSAFSWWMDIWKWWDYYDFDYWFLVDYNEYEPFLNKSKWIPWLFMVRDTYFKNDGFDINMLVGFCWLSLTNTTIDRTKSPIDVVNDTILNNEISKLIWDFWILVPISWSALDLVVQSLSGSWIYEVSNLWEQWYNLFTRFQLVHSNNVWILPNYIIVWFLAILLLYLLRK